MFQSPPGLLFLASLVAGTALHSSVHAAPAAIAESSGVTVPDAWARASPGAATTGAAYLTLRGGAQADQLVAAATPVAATAEVHETTNDNGIMKMRRAPSVVIPQGQSVTFAPGGYHIMLMGLKHPLVVGDTFPLTLTFAHAAPVTVDVQVRTASNRPPMQMH